MADWSGLGLVARVVAVVGLPVTAGEATLSEMVEPARRVGWRKLVLLPAAGIAEAGRGGPAMLSKLEMGKVRSKSVHKVNDQVPRESIWAKQKQTPRDPSRSPSHMTQRHCFPACDLLIVFLSAFLTFPRRS